jgi:hypothetical protein
VRFGGVGIRPSPCPSRQEPRVYGRVRSGTAAKGGCGPGGVVGVGKWGAIVGWHGGGRAGGGGPRAAGAAVLGGSDIAEADVPCVRYALRTPPHYSRYCGDSVTCSDRCIGPSRSCHAAHWRRDTQSGKIFYPLPTPPTLHLHSSCLHGCNFQLTTLRDFRRFAPR